MNYRTKLVPVLLGLLITSVISLAQEGDSEFETYLEEYSTIWNKHDRNALTAFFTADADLIMGNLPRIVGREAIGNWWDSYFSRIDTCRKGEFRLLSVREITPDVQIVNISSETFGTDKYGSELETRLARGTWVLVNRNGSWFIAAMRGLPAVGDHRSSPGVDR